MKACLPTGTMVVQVAATDADDPTYGNSARVVYSIIHGQPYFSVEPKTGRYDIRLEESDGYLMRRCGCSVSFKGPGNIFFHPALLL